MARASRKAARPFWVQLVPFAMILGIFYFVILLPMRKRQKKVAEFQDSAQGRRPGDHHQRHLRHDHQGQRQLRAAPDRREGQRSRWPRPRSAAIRDRIRSCPNRASSRTAGRAQPRPGSPRASAMKNLRWKLLTILAVLALRGVFYPPFDTPGRRGRISLGLDLKGGVHLVLRVQTDDALQLETRGLPPNGCARRCARRTSPAPTVTVPGRRPGSSSPACRRPRMRRSGRSPTQRRSRRMFNRTGGAGGYTLRDEAEHGAQTAATRRSSRRCRPSSAASTPSAWPSRSSRRTASAGDQILVQLPGVNDPEQVKRIIGSTALLELKIVEAGPASSQEALLAGRQRRRAARHGSDHRRRPRRTRVRSPITWCASVAPVTGRDLRKRAPRLDENNLPAVGFSMNRDGAIKFGKLTGDNVGKPLAVILDNRVADGRQHPGADHRQGPHLRQLHASRKSPTSSLMLRSGALPAGADLPRRAHRRPVARRRLDPRRRHRVARRPGAGRAVHAGLLQAVAASTRSSRSR